MHEALYGWSTPRGGGRAGDCLAQGLDSHFAVLLCMGVATEALASSAEAQRTWAVAIMGQHGWHSVSNGLGCLWLPGKRHVYFAFPPKAISSSSPGPPLLGFPGGRWGRSGERDWNVTSPCSERCCDPQGLCHRGGDALTPWDGSLAPSLGQVKGVCSGSGLIWKTLGKSAQQDY